MYIEYDLICIKFNSRQQSIILEVRIVVTFREEWKTSRSGQERGLQRVGNTPFPNLSCNNLSIFSLSTTFINVVDTIGTPPRSHFLNVSFPKLMFVVSGGLHQLHWYTCSENYPRPEEVASLRSVIPEVVPSYQGDPQTMAECYRSTNWRPAPSPKLPLVFQSSPWDHSDPRLWWTCILLLGDNVPCVFHTFAYLVSQRHWMTLFYMVLTRMSVE